MELSQELGNYIFFSCTSYNEKVPPHLKIYIIGPESIEPLLLKVLITKIQYIEQYTL